MAKCSLHVTGGLVGMTPHEVEATYKVTVMKGDIPLLRTFESKDDKLKQWDYILIIGSVEKIGEILTIDHQNVVRRD